MNFFTNVLFIVTMMRPPVVIQRGRHCYKNRKLLSKNIFPWSITIKDDFLVAIVYTISHTDLHAQAKYYTTEAVFTIK
jgi:hypothetical protein